MIYISAKSVLRLITLSVGIYHISLLVKNNHYKRTLPNLLQYFFCYMVLSVHGYCKISERNTNKAGEYDLMVGFVRFNLAEFKPGQVILSH